MKNQIKLNNLRIRMNCMQVFLLTLLACGMMCTNTNAQLYTRTTFNAAYVPITVGTGATVSTATGNDVAQTAIPLGFTFNYAGINYTTVSLNTNGLLFFDAVAPSAAEGAYNNNMFVLGAGGTDKSISAWWTDMADDASSDILYQTQGTAGTQTFTVQYTNYPHYTGAVGTNIRLNFQVIFYEGSNVIEFNYGSRAIAGPPTVSGGACIGIEYGTGGAGNFIDLVTGSGRTAHGMLSPLVAWPAYSYRLTPGAPTPVAAGTYNVGMGQTYPSLTLATSDLNHRGISGAVTLNLTDNNYDTTVANGSHIFPVFVGPFKNSNSVNTVTIIKTGTPATFSYRGSPVVQGGFGCGGTGGLSAFDDSQEPIMGVSAKYTTISNINLVSLGATASDVEIGLMVFESFGGDSGAQHNVFDKISVNMDRTNTNTIGIHSNNMSNPGGIQGSNSFNTYRDITIRDCYAGIYLQGAGGVYEPDAGNQIISSSCTVFNSIGDPAVPNDIGGGSATYGIWLGAQNTFILRNTIIRNITTTSSASSIDGILVQSAKGVCEISNCSIRTIRRSSTGAGGSFILTGIRLSHSNSINEFRIFNNSISELLTNYTGVATASYAVRGIYFDDTGSGTNTFNIYNNSISIDGSTFPNASNTCIQFLDGGPFTVNMKNNVFANFTSTQTGVARHFCIVSSSVDRYGLAASLSDYNDLYIPNDQGTSGHVGLGATTTYSTLAAWQTGMSFNPGTDANSFSANPNFVNNATDLHATALSTALDETGTTIPAFITTDIDCQTRVAPHDIGSDDFTSGCAAPPAPTGNATQNFCSGANPTVANLTATGTTIQWYATSSGGGALPLSTPLVNGIHYHATQTVTGCESTVRLDVTAVVSSAPPAINVLVPPIINLPASACNGTSVLNLNIPAVPNTTQYIWDGPAGTTFNGGANPYTSSTPSADIAFGNPNGSGYYIGVQASNACGTTVRKSQWVRGSVSVPASVSGVNVVCANSSGGYSCPTVTGATTYSWTTTGDMTVTSGNGTENVTVSFGPSFTSGTLCVAAGTSCFTSATKCMTLTSSVAVLPVISGTTSVCPGVYVYTLPVNPNIASYAWTIPPNSSGSSTTNSISLTVQSGFSSANLCVVGTSICGVNTASRCIGLTTSVPARPASIAGVTNGLCGQTVVYTCPSVGPVTYTWTAPSGATINSGQGTNAINVTMGTFTTGQVCVTTSNACGTATPRCISVNGKPNPPGAITAMPASWCANTSGVQFDVNVAPIGGSYTLSWQYPGPTVATYSLGGGNSTQLILDWITGSGPVNVTATNACGNSTRTSTQASSCRESFDYTQDDNHSINVFPNPANDVLTVAFTSATTSQSRLQLLDITGKAIITETVNTSEGLNHHSLNVSKIAKGIYMVTINGENTNSKIKVVIQ